MCKLYNTIKLVENYKRYNDLRVFKSKRINEVRTNQWYKVCTITLDTIGDYDNTSFVMLIPCTTSFYLIAQIAIGSDSQGLALDRINASSLSTYCIQTSYTLPIGFIVSEDKKTCTVYTKNTANYMIGSYLSLLGITSEQTINFSSSRLHFTLNGIYDSTINDETEFDKKIILTSENSMYKNYNNSRFQQGDFFYRLSGKTNRRLTIRPIQASCDINMFIYRRSDVSVASLCGASDYTQGFESRSTWQKLFGWGGRDSSLGLDENNMFYIDTISSNEYLMIMGVSKNSFTITETAIPS